MARINLKISTNILFNIFFFIYLLTSGTNLKLNLSLGTISTMLTAFSVLIPIVIIFSKIKKTSFSSENLFIFTLASLIIFSSFLNLFLQVPSYIGIVQTLSFALPWLVLIAAIMSKEYILENSNKFLDWFNNFIVILLFFGIIEYIACFGFGIIPPLVETANGDFFVGYTTVFHVIDGTELPHFRFYGPFGEPGELAMWSSILFVYNMYRKNYFSMIVILFALLGAFSPSAFIALFIPFIIFSIKRKSIMSFLSFLAGLLTMFIYRNEITLFYNTVLSNKARSLSTRFDNLIDFFNSLSDSFLNYPLGIPFYETTKEKLDSGMGYLSNFTPIYAFESGGLIAFFCYILILLFGLYVSIKTILFSRNYFLDYEISIYFLMLFTYIVQRGSLLEYAIFPMLFGAIYINQSKNRKVKLNV